MMQVCTIFITGALEKITPDIYINKEIIFAIYDPKLSLYFTARFFDLLYTACLGGEKVSGSYKRRHIIEILT